MNNKNTPRKRGRQPIYDEPMTRKTLYLPDAMWQQAAEMVGMSPQKAVRAIVEMVVKDSPKCALCNYSPLLNLDRGVGNCMCRGGGQRWRIELLGVVDGKQ